MAKSQQSSRVSRRTAVTLLVAAAVALAWGLVTSLLCPRVTSKKDLHSANAIPKSDSISMLAPEQGVVSNRSPVGEPLPLSHPNSPTTDRSYVTLVDASTGAPPPEQEWIVTAVESPGVFDGSAPSIRVNFDALGRGELLHGLWRLEDPGGRYRTIQDSFRVGDGSLTLVWLSREFDQEVIVLDREREPIEGASVSWSRRLRQHREAVIGVPDLWAYGRAYTEWTDRDGRALLERIGIPDGHMVVSAAGHKTVTISEIGIARGTLTVVLERSETRCLTLMIHDSIDGSPIPNAVITDASGRIGESGRDGIAELPPDTLQTNDSLLVEAAGYYPMHMLTSERRDAQALELALVPACRALIRYVGEGTAQVWLSQASPVNLPAIVESTQQIPRRVQAESSTTLALPYGTCTLAAINDQGEYWNHFVQVSSPELEIELGAPRAPLAAVLRIRSGEGHVAGLSARLVRRSGPTLELGSVDGVVSVPVGVECSRIEVSGESTDVVVLEPRHQGGQVNLGGEIVVELEKIIPVEIEVRTPDLLPSGPVLVTAHRTRSGFASYPELGGGWPTSHPGWIRFQGRAQSATTDPWGHGLIQLASGSYRLHLSAPSVWKGPRLERPLVELKFIDVDVAADSDEPIVLDWVPPRFVEMHVLEDGSGTPAARFKISAGRLGSRQVVGSVWRGPIDGSVRELLVEGELGDPVRVALPDEPLGEPIRVVLVE